MQSLDDEFNRLLSAEIPDEEEKPENDEDVDQFESEQALREELENEYEQKLQSLPDGVWNLAQQRYADLKVLRKSGALSVADMNFYRAWKRMEMTIDEREYEDASKLISSGSTSISTSSISKLLERDEDGYTERENKLFELLDGNTKVYIEHEEFVKYIDRHELLAKFYDVEFNEKSLLKKFYKRIKKEYDFKWPFYQKEKKAKKAK